MDFIEYKILKIKDNFIENGRYEEAIDRLKKLLNKYPTNAEIFYFLGVAYQKVNKHGLAIECFTRADEIDPMIKGLNLRLRYSINFVIKDYGLEELNQYDIDEDTLYKTRALYCEHSKLYEQAIDELKKSIELNPTDWPAYRSIAENYQKIGDNEKALKFYDKALSTDSIDFEGIIEILFEKSSFYIKCNKLKDALNTLHRLMKISIEDIEKYIDSLNFLHGHDEYDELIEICEKHIGRNPKDIHAILNKGIMLLLKGELIEAEHNFSMAISLAPKNPSVRFYLGVTYYLLEEPENAIKSVLSACALDFSNNYYNTFYKQLKKQVDF